MTVPGACSDLRVLDLSTTPAGRLAAMVLADFGADVVRVDPEGAEAPHVMLDRGKRSVAHDPRGDEGREALRELAAGADVLIETFGAGEADRLGLGFEQLARDNPGLVHCGISPFGSTGPLAHLDGDDWLIMARAGTFRDQLGWRDVTGTPVFRAAAEPTYLAAMLTIQGALAALRARDLTGEGQRVETSLLQAVVGQLNPRVRWMRRDGEPVPRGDGYRPPVPRGTPIPEPPPSLSGMLVECADGRYITHALFERDFFPRWIAVLGLDHIWDDPRFAGAPFGVPDLEDRRELGDLVRARMKERTAAEWMELFVADGNVCADVVQTTEEAMAHRQLAAAEQVVEYDDPEVGRVVAVGPIAKVPGAPAEVRGPAPRAGAHTAELAAAPWPARARREPTGARLSGPLDGLLFVDAASHYASPAGAAWLADLGARVVKVERTTGDPYRHAVRGMGEQNLVRSMQGKEDLAVDLKDPRGREVVHRLVERADGFQHNFRFGVAERLGIDWETLHALNPRLVYLYSSSFGSVGPYRAQPAIDHVISAFTGTSSRQTGEGNPAFSDRGADPMAAAANAVAMLLGLHARDRTGEGQYVETAMTLAGLYLNYAGAFAHEGRAPRPPVDPGQFGTGPTHRLYETASERPDRDLAPYEHPDAQWVFLSAVRDDQFARFVEAAGRSDLADDPRFASEAARDRNRHELEAELAALFLTRPARDWEADMVAAGVGVMAADAITHLAFLHHDPQAVALGMMTTAEHPSFGGTYWRHAPAVRHSATPGTVGPYCEVGEHTRALLAELGYSDAEIGGLADAGVVAWPEDGVIPKLGVDA
jgi:crotonobetainyl-CoA:carnitine CoA-transferase CaiB-like acyl-CoA transferase